jgi:undecaprenol kinase
MKQSIFSSFLNAGSGLKNFCCFERNAQIQLVISAGVILAGWLFCLSKQEWLAVLICIMTVLVMEMVNTAIEKLSDVVQESYHPGIKMVKDLSAGAVLLAAIVSVVIGCIIFIPKIGW